jgi:hypothetical protein
MSPSSRYERFAELRHFTHLVPTRADALRDAIAPQKGRRRADRLLMRHLRRFDWPICLGSPGPVLSAVITPAQTPAVKPTAAALASTSTTTFAFLSSRNLQWSSCCHRLLQLNQ